MKRVALVVAFVVAWSAAAGASSTYDVNVDAHVKATVLVVGDSNIELGAARIALAFTDRGDAYIPILAPRSAMGIRGYWADMRPTSRDYWQIRLSQLLTRVQPDVVVVELGINDASQVGTATTSGYGGYEQKISWLLAALPDVPVLWTNLPCKLEPDVLLTGCQAINRALVNMNDQIKVVNWAAAARDHPEYMIDGQVHLTTEGQTAYASTVVQALNAIP